MALFAVSPSTSIERYRMELLRLAAATTSRRSLAVQLSAADSYAEAKIFNLMCRGSFPCRDSASCAAVGSSGSAMVPARSIMQ